MPFQDVQADMVVYCIDPSNQLQMKLKSLVDCIYLSDECDDDPTNNLSEFGEIDGLDENMKQDK
jgi:hypothetical protein